MSTIGPNHHNLYMYGVEGRDRGRDRVRDVKGGEMGRERGYGSGKKKRDVEGKAKVKAR